MWRYRCTTTRVGGFHRNRKKRRRAPPPCVTGLWAAGMNELLYLCCKWSP